MLGRFEVAHSAYPLVSRDASAARGSTNNPRTEPYLTLVTMVPLDFFHGVLPPDDPVRDHHRPTLVVANDLSRPGTERRAEDRGERRRAGARAATRDGPCPFPRAKPAPATGGRRRGFGDRRGQVGVAPGRRA